MSLYMFQASYTALAIKALVNNPQNREAAARTVIEAAGGKLLNMYFCFGTSDVIAIIEAPDDKAMVSCSLAIGASGAFSSGSTISLMTAADAMEAMQAAKPPQPFINRQLVNQKLARRMNLHLLRQKYPGEHQPNSADPRKC